ncbi:MAG: 1-deoxy-D-xylulose-5-phosphate reductoisomerase [Siculibacillus sp.]|nr:1-deoxy-D-xylulose-5-phosphate reductoisomerase [Siculibacillus sp.]
MKKITILGASGSIGRSAIAFLRLHRDKFALDAVAFGRGWETAAAIVEEFGCSAVSFADPQAAEAFRACGRSGGCEVLSGPKASAELAARPVDTVLAAISGSAGFPSVLAAIEAGNRLALANKEALVCGGPQLLVRAKERGAVVVPIDSEHSAIFQCHLAGRPNEVAKILLTGSGGPFRTWSKEAIRRATPADAAKHPNWSMGPKITLDSATLANKGLELIETAYLFDIEESRIEVLINTSSILHSAVHYVDGSLIAMLGAADMRNAIGYGLTWPERLATGVDLIDLARIGRLEFERVDDERFPCLGLARHALHSGQGGTMMYNAANEVAGRLFMKGAIGFTDIPAIIDRCLAGDTARFASDLDHVVTADREAKAFAKSVAERHIAEAA